MRYEVDVRGRIRQVDVKRSGDGFAVTVDGRTLHIDVARIDAHSLSLLVDSVWSKDVAVTPDAVNGGVVVHMGSVAIPVVLNGRRRWGRKEDGASAGSGPQRITAPMPGKISRVLVAPGDAVQPRQPLIVVEAMKMENELRAGRAGTVADVVVREGMSVEAGALLIVIQ